MLLDISEEDLCCLRLFWYLLLFMPLRVRHYTDDVGLAGIQRAGRIQSSRGWGSIESGVHVEVEPFATAIPYAPLGRSSPLNDFACCGEGAFVEFDAPDSLVPNYCGPRGAGIIPVPVGERLRLEALHPLYVKVRFHWWQWWRTKVK
jgi:hypothetical protein